MNARSILLSLCVCLALACGGTTAPPSSSGDGGRTCLAGCQRGFRCTGSVCAVDPTGQWVLTVTQGSILDHKPSGEAWDSFGGLPDAFVCLTINGARTCTATRDDTIAPSWNESFPVASATALQAGVFIEYGDYDSTSANDPICGSSTLTIQDSNFASGAWGAQCPSGSFNATLTAR